MTEILPCNEQFFLRSVQELAWKMLSKISQHSRNDKPFTRLTCFGPVNDKKLAGNCNKNREQSFQDEDPSIESVEPFDYSLLLDIIPPPTAVARDAIHMGNSIRQKSAEGPGKDGSREEDVESPL